MSEIPKVGKLGRSEFDTGKELDSKYINHMDHAIDVYLIFRLSRKQDFVKEVEDFENYPKSSYLGGLSRKVQQV